VQSAQPHKARGVIKEGDWQHFSVLPDKLPRMPVCSELLCCVWASGKLNQ